MSVASILTNIATAIALFITVIVLPAILFAVVDDMLATNLYDIYLPVLAMTIQLISAVFIIFAYLIDLVVNNIIDFFNFLGFRFYHRSSFQQAVPLFTEQITAAVTILLAATTTRGRSKLPSMVDDTKDTLQWWK